MKYRTLGRTGVQISTVVLGGNTFGAGVDEAGTKAVVARALELGINFVDTAESYSAGVSETLLGKALAGHRDEFVLATKTGSGQEPPGRLSRMRIVARLEASLRRLGTDYVDVYYFHFPDPATPLEESLRALEDLVRSGKVLYPAVSNHAAWRVAEMQGIAQRHDWSTVVCAQNGYNLLQRDVERELLPACEHLGVSFIPHSPLAGGLLTGKYRRGAPLPAGSRYARTERMRGMLSDKNFDALERYEAFSASRGKAVGDLAIAWLLTRPSVASVIAGVTSVAQLEEHARAGEWELTSEEIKDLA